MMDVSGLTLSASEKIQLSKPSVGGVILFSRNYVHIEQIKDLVALIRAINPDLLIAVDHEGGRVQRFKADFTIIPPMSEIGKFYSKNKKEALSMAFSCGWILAAELLAIGVDFSFAPVLDVDYGNSSVIGNRAFSDNADEVVALAGALIDGMHQAGMKCVGKHFPGHGFVTADSHFDLPIDNRLISEIDTDIAVFAKLSTKLDAIMPAHVIYAQVDDKPAGFSSKWIQDILQTQLGFDGVVFSDDLSMQGAHFIGNITQRVQISLDSGCDMVLICNQPELVTEVINQDWQGSEKLHSMRGVRCASLDKIAHSTHLAAIKDL